MSYARHPEVPLVSVHSYGVRLTVHIRPGFDRGVMVDLPVSDHSHATMNSCVTCCHTAEYPPVSIGKP